ncbi:hypothetical protein KP509_20G092600 [Ceratopteris richardii]|nr:hypothetical protein KP509_20G092600 [Ceratopteris richardii]
MRIVASSASRVRSGLMGARYPKFHLRKISCAERSAATLLSRMKEAENASSYMGPSSQFLRLPAAASFGRSYRRQPIPNVSELDLEEEVSRIDMDPKKMMEPGDPGAIQAVIKDVMPVGYFVSLPSGRDGYLPADDLGFTGGLAVLQRLFKEGQQITVRIVCRGGAGREIVSIKKPQFAPPSEQKTIESLRLHFEQEKKNRMNPRNRRHQNYY